MQRYALEMAEWLRWQWRSPRWRVDDTYVELGGRWTYLHCALDMHGDTIGLFFTRSAKARKRFLSKALSRPKDCEKPHVINTDKAPRYNVAIAKLRPRASCRQTRSTAKPKFLNKIVEADHGKHKQLIRPVRSFKSRRTA